MGQDKQASDDFFETWMKTATSFWNEMANAWAGGLKGSQSGASSEDSDNNRARESLSAIIRMWQTAFSTMNEPETVNYAFQGFNTLPEIFLKMAQTGISRSIKLQQQWMENAGKAFQRTEAYSFENLDERVHNAWSEIYEQEFSKFLKVPQLGLTRFYQEKMGRLLDCFNVFQNALGRFMHVLYLPMEKTGRVWKDEIETMTREKNLPANSQEYYRMWIKILESHYMTLFKSREYTQILNETLAAMEDFLAARQDVLEDSLQSLPVPTQKEMDELYKELYLLKKKVRQLEKKPQAESTQT